MQNALEKPADATAKPSGPPNDKAQDVLIAPWIYLCTPQHTGTHFLRLLLELHPRVSFWKCGRTEIEGRTMVQWQKLHRDGEISLRELLRLGVRCEPDLPAWSINEAERLGITIPDKNIEFDLVHAHASVEPFWYSSLPTVVTIRDPLVAVISGIRRTGPEAAESTIDGLHFLARKKGRGECFFFCVDLWEGQRERALELLSYLGLGTTQQIHDYLSCWSSQNSTGRDDHPIHDASPELAEARQWAMERKGVHPAVAKWAERIRAAELQPFFESLGYRDLVWYE